MPLMDVGIWPVFQIFLAAEKELVSAPQALTTTTQHAVLQLLVG